MRTRKNYGLYAIALAIVVVGALAIGALVGILAPLGLVLVCPLMMYFMMRGMHGGHHGGSHHDADPSDPHKHDQRPGAGRP